RRPRRSRNVVLRLRKSREILANCRTDTCESKSSTQDLCFEHRRQNLRPRTQTPTNRATKKVFLYIFLHFNIFRFVIARVGWG
ncbi:hypothetical protein HK102_006747, partial [Quaeritorhiza haematococci]